MKLEKWVQTAMNAILSVSTELRNKFHQTCFILKIYRTYHSSELLLPSGYQTHGLLLVTKTYDHILLLLLQP